jgi:Flp pilus assembly protein TadG
MDCDPIDDDYLAGGIGCGDSAELPFAVDPVARFVAEAGPSARGERGAALVEFVLLVPLFVVLILGLVTAGIVYNHNLDVVHAAREGARYGATVPQSQCTDTSKCSGSTWAGLVRSLVVERSDGDVSAAQVCVALVAGTSGTPINSTFTTNTDGSHCYDDGNADTAARVQVRIVRTGDSINAAFFTIPVTLTSNATAKFEL